MQLLNRVYQVAGPMYAAHQNVYAIRGEESIVLVDTGADARDFDIISRNLAVWDLAQLPVSQVLLTHAHYEHSANAWRFRELGARVVAHDLDAAAIENGDDRTAAFAYAGRGPFRPCPVDVRVSGGDRIDSSGLSFEVIHVPGHSPGSVIYRLILDGQVILFTGDTILTGMLCHTSALGWTGGVDYDQAEYFNSLRNLSSQTADIVLPGHGEVCMRQAGNLLPGAFLQARLTFGNQLAANEVK